MTDRTTRFMTRVDAHLATLNANGKRAFLDEQIAKWEARYDRFITSDGKSEPVTDPADPPQASDYLLTISALTALRIQHGYSQKVSVS